MVPFAVALVVSFAAALVVPFAVGLVVHFLLHLNIHLGHLAGEIVAVAVSLWLVVVGWHVIVAVYVVGFWFVGS